MVLVMHYHFSKLMTNAIKGIYFSEHIIGDIWETLADLVNWMWEGS
jgi:hypothetical protein